MAIQKFRDQDLSKYYYDTVRKAVMSTRSGTAKALTWSQARSWYPKRVSMVTNHGYKVNYTENQVLNMLMPAEQEKAVQAVTNDLSLLAPDFPFVLYSDKNICSQYFYANTTIKQALDMFARRGEHIDPKDIRILNTRTGKVSMLKPKVVTMYELV